MEKAKLVTSELKIDLCAMLIELEKLEQRICQVSLLVALMTSKGLWKILEIVIRKFKNVNSKEPGERL